MSKSNQYNQGTNTNQIPRHQCQSEEANPMWGFVPPQTTGYMNAVPQNPQYVTGVMPKPNHSAQDQPDGHAESNWESEGGAVSPESELNEYGEKPGDICCQRSAGGRCYFHSLKFQTTDTSDLKEPELCSECNRPVNMVEFLRERIQLRRQFLFEELDVLDKDERLLNNTEVSETFNRYTDYI